MVYLFGQIKSRKYYKYNSKKTIYIKNVVFDKNNNDRC